MLLCVWSLWNQLTILDNRLRDFRHKKLRRKSMILTRILIKLFWVSQICHFSYHFQFRDWYKMTYLKYINPSSIADICCNTSHWDRSNWWHCKFWSKWRCSWYSACPLDSYKLINQVAKRSAASISGSYLGQEVPGLNPATVAKLLATLFVLKQDCAWY